MARQAPSFSIGIEEELFIVDKKSREIVSQLPAAFLKQCEQHFSEQIVPEFLSSQVEIITRPHKSIREACTEYQALRKCVIDVADQFDLAPIAASTHPFSSWREQKPNVGRRYHRLAEDLRVSARRMLVSGMHIHIGIENENHRLMILNYLCWYLPHLLALSTSSPFWSGMDTGLNSYRLSVVDGLPRSGLPEYCATMKEYNQYVDILKRAGVIENARELWWDARMSCRYPTIEMRITDVCTKIDDAVSIAALYQCLIRWIDRRKDKPTRDDHVSFQVTRENRWRAQRFPLARGSLIDCFEDKLVSYPEKIKYMVEKLQEDAEALDCVAELNGIRSILTHGTSADQQRKIFKRQIKDGKTEKAALKSVVDHLIEETRIISQHVDAKKLELAS